MRAPIQSTKKYINITTATVTSGARTYVSLATAVAVPTAANDEIKSGSMIKAVYIELWANTATANIAFASTLAKLPSGAAGPTYAELVNLNDFAGKKNVLEFHEGLLPSNGMTVPIYRHWVKIPKGKQRFGLSDNLGISIGGIGGSVNYCGFATYKAYE